MNKELSNHHDCPLCLSNNMFKGEIIARTDVSYLTAADSRPGNYLIIPIEHVELLTDLPDSWWQDVKKLLKSIPNPPTSYNVSFNIGKDAGQTLKHLHMWIVPRYSGLPSSGRGLVTLVERVNEVG